MNSREVVIRRFAIGPLAQWGFVAGVVAACLPAFLCSWILFSLLAGLRALLAGWRDVGLEILGQHLSFNLVELLGLQNALQTTSNIAGLGLFGIVLLAIVLAIALGVFGAVVMSLLGLFYNTTGRVRLELEEVNVPASLESMPVP
jgi:hypothetical protein